MRETYVPEQDESSAWKPKPLIEVLDALEAEIRKAKVEGQSGDWIKNLRLQAEIEIRPDCLD